MLDGELTREAAIADDARRNQAFAKRQRTWFRSEPESTWLDGRRERPAAVVDGRETLPGYTFDRP